MGSNDTNFTVFVDGEEVSDYLMEHETATLQARDYVYSGYEDVQIYNYRTGEFKKVGK